MLMFQNCPPLYKNKNSLLDIKLSKNETQEDKTLSNFSFKYDNTFCSSQDNESPFSQREEDSNTIFWQETDKSINDIYEESFNFLHIPEKSIIEKNLPLMNQSNITYDENFSLDNKCLSNDSNDMEYGKNILNSPKLNDEDEKMSGLSGDSFLSDIYPNQDFMNLEMNDFNFKNLIEEGKNDSFYSNNNIKESKEENMKEKIMKKEKVNFLIQRESKINSYICNNIISKNMDNLDTNMSNINRKKKSPVDNNEYIGKKRNKDMKQKTKQISINIKLKEVQTKNKVTVINSKAYKCECGKIFSTEENQRLHFINIHLHEKPYSCSFCGEGFSHRNGRIYHERVFHTFIFPYLCKECNSAFASKSALIYHMKSKHKIS